MQTEPDNRWLAELELGFSPTEAKTVLARRRRFGPLSVQRPFYPEKNVCHVYLLHPPGGVVGGDRLNIQVQCDQASHALITTPGATKFYRSGGEIARQTQQLSLENEACLEWLPQDNIFFPGAKVALTTQIYLKGHARAAVWEINCFGRPTIDEAFTKGIIESRFEVWRDNKPVLLECLKLNDSQPHYLSTLQSKPVSATLVMTHADNAALELARTSLLNDDEQNSGATLKQDLLIVRYLGYSTEQARQMFSIIWSQLRRSLIGKEACIPRIWNT
jgi:urease accessory protein